MHGHALTVLGKDVSKIELALSTELMLVQEWLADNKLSLHLGKTESILFASKKRVRKNHDMNVTCIGNDKGAGNIFRHNYRPIYQEMLLQTR